MWLFSLSDSGQFDTYTNTADFLWNLFRIHYNEVIMGAIASQITNLMIVYSTVYSSADQRKHQSSASLAFAWGIHRWPVNSPHKWPVTRKILPFNDVIMHSCRWLDVCYKINMSYQYMKSHCKDHQVVRSSYILGILKYITYTILLI